MLNYIFWPSILPQPQLKSYVIDAQSNKIVTSMETGQKKHREQYSTHMDTIHCSWIFNVDQLTVFEHFYHVILQSATKDFHMEIGDDFYQNTINARFLSGYQVTMDNINYYNVSAQLQRTSRSLISKTEYELFVYMPEIKKLNNQTLEVLQGRRL